MTFDSKQNMQFDDGRDYKNRHKNNYVVKCQTLQTPTSIRVSEMIKNYTCLSSWILIRIMFKVIYEI